MLIASCTCAIDHSLMNRIHFLTRLLLLAALGTLVSCSSSKTTNPPPTAAKVELDRYVGKWYEIARMPMPFQKDDEPAMAEYGKNSDGTVSVHNTALKPDGGKREIRGTATVLNPGVNTKLAVRFNTWFGPLIPVPAEGNYWILHIDPGYTQAIVGTPSRNFLWILARSPKLSEPAYSALVAKAKSLGFATESLIRDNHR